MGLEEDLQHALGRPETDCLSLLKCAIEAHGRDAVHSWKAQDKHKHRLLHSCVQKGFANVIRELVKTYGFDVNVQRDSDGCAPLHLAIFYKKAPVIRALIDLEADRTLQNKYGEACDEKYEKWLASFSNIIWLDLEMTNGFYEGPMNAKVLECAIVITDKDLNELDTGHWVIAGYSKQDLEALSDFHQKFFRDAEDGGEFPPLPDTPGNGLFSRVLAATKTKDEVEKEMIDLILKHCPARGCPLAGNSVQCDREVLCHEMPSFVKNLNHQIIDVSSFIGVARRWLPWKEEEWKEDQKAHAIYDHSAVNDVRASIQALRWIRGNLLVKPSE